MKTKRLLALFVSAAVLGNILTPFAAASGEASKDLLRRDVERYNYVIPSAAAGVFAGADRRFL